MGFCLEHGLTVTGYSVVESSSEVMIVVVSVQELSTLLSHLNFETKRMFLYLELFKGMCST